MSPWLDKLFNLKLFFVFLYAFLDTVLMYFFVIVIRREIFHLWDSPLLYWNRQSYAILFMPVRVIIYQFLYWFRILFFLKNCWGVWHFRIRCQFDAYLLLWILSLYFRNIYRNCIYFLNQTRRRHLLHSSFSLFVN